MSPRRPSVIICSAIGLTAFALVTVVLMRPCSISAPARFAYSALRCDESRPSFLPVRWCRTGRLLNLLSTAAVLGPPLSPRSRSPCWPSVSLTSSIDFLPKFGIEASSFSVFVTRSPIVSMPTRFRQLYERTPSSSSSIGKFSIPCASETSTIRRCRAPAGRPRSPPTLSRSVKIASWRIRISAACAIASFRIDRAVRRDVEDQLVVVGALPDARRLHVVRDAAGSARTSSRPG